MSYPEQGLLFNLGISLEAAREVRTRIMNAQYAVNTVRNYRSSWSSFERWCRDTGRRNLPATPQTCIDHAAWCIAEGLRLETVYLRLKAINHYHREADLATPFEVTVRQFMRNARRDLHEKPQGKEALTPAQLRQISKVFRGRRTVFDTRDRAMILLCFACGWRCSELVSLDLRDIKWVDAGLVMRLGKSKMDQEGRGRTVGIRYGRRQLTCPVRALKEWLAIRGPWNGALFTPMDRHNLAVRRRLDSDAVRRAVKRGLDLIGEDASAFGAHSLRAGMITASVEAGASETAIMQRTGQKCYETLRRYVRPAQAFLADPLAGVL